MSTDVTRQLRVGSLVQGGTEGSVLFIGPGSVISQDNANFFWDDTNNILGIGTASPVSLLSLAGSTSTTFGLELVPAGWSLKHHLNVPYSGDTLFLGVNSKLTSATAGTLDDVTQAGTGLILTTVALNYVQASAGSGSRTLCIHPFFVTAG